MCLYIHTGYMEIWTHRILIVCEPLTFSFVCIYCHTTSIKPNTFIFWFSVNIQKTLPLVQYTHALQLGSFVFSCLIILWAYKVHIETHLAGFNYHLCPILKLNTPTVSTITITIRLFWETVCWKPQKIILKI